MKVQRIKVLVTALFFTTFGSAQTVETFTSSGSFVVPSGTCQVTSGIVECWGGGGAGGGQSAAGSNGGAGGGAGGYSIATIAVTPGATIAYTVGAGGAGGTGNGGNGGATTFSTVTASGGSGGAANGGAAGTGGAGSTQNGGNGITGGTTTGGGGGASGSSSGVGVSALGQTGATAPTDGGNGGGGGNAGANGTAGTAPGGGGGGGGDRSGGSESGGNGGSGRIRITYFSGGAGSGCDPCSAVQVAAFPFSYTGNTTGYSNYLTGGCYGNYLPTSGGGTDMFFELNVAADSHYEVSLTGTSAANIMEMSAISGTSCSGSFSCVANGSWGGGLQTTGTTLGSTSAASDSPCRTIWFETAGTYYLRVDAGTGVAGAFTLNVDEITPSATPNGGDACLNATGMTSSVPSTINADNCSFSMDADDPAPGLVCAGSLENTAWLEFQSDGGGSPVTVSVSGVSCSSGYAACANPPACTVAGFYSASGQFGIFTSSTGACGGTYTSADACQSLSTGATYSTSLPNATPTTYFLVWDGNGGAECDFTLTATNVIALPAEIVSFRAKKEKDNNEIVWKVASESNLSYYSIESSPNGQEFKEIGVVVAQGNTSQNMDYVFPDYEYHLPRSFYRLKMVDYDGVFKYSHVAAIDRSSEYNGLTLNVFPNPTDGLLTLQSNAPNAGNVNIKVISLLGQVVYNQKDYFNEGQNARTFDLSHLAKGMYHIVIDTGTEKKTLQFVKQQ